MDVARLDYATPPPPPLPRWHWPVVWTWVLVPILFGIALGFVGSQLGPTPFYSITGRLAVDANGVMTPGMRAATQQACIAALTSPAFVALIAARTGVPAASIAANVQITAVANYGLLVIGYTSRSPKEGVNVVSAMIAGRPSQVTVLEYPTMPPSAPKSPLAAMCGTACGILAGVISCHVLRRWQEQTPG